jgi:uncharacterized protein
VRRSLGARPAVAVTIGSLAAFDVIRSAWIPSRLDFAANIGMIGVVGGIAAWSGLTRSDLGLARAGVRPGCRLGALAFAGIATAIGTAALVPSVRDAMIEQATTGSFVDMFVQAVLRIPLGTVVLEELAFRGLLLANLGRVVSRRGAFAWSVAAFAVWHLPPLLGSSTSGAAGESVASGRLGLVAVTLASTAAAGGLFTMLRVRSGSLIAPAAAHVATNSVPFALAWWLAR